MSIYVIFFCKITAWYKKNDNTIIVRKHKNIIKRIIFISFLSQKVKFEKIKKIVLYNYISL